MLGNAKKARNKLNWRPKTTLDELIEEMISFDLKNAEKEAFLKENGYSKNKISESQEKNLKE